MCLLNDVKGLFWSVAGGGFRVLRQDNLFHTRIITDNPRRTMFNPALTPLRSEGGPCVTGTRQMDAFLT
jgi:hypothetical protein